MDNFFITPLPHRIIYNQYYLLEHITDCIVLHYLIIIKKKIIIKYNTLTNYVIYAFLIYNIIKKYVIK